MASSSIRLKSMPSLFQILCQIRMKRFNGLSSKKKCESKILIDLMVTDVVQIEILNGKRAENPIFPLCGKILDKQ